MSDLYGGKVAKAWTKLAKGVSVYVGFVTPCGNVPLEVLRVQINHKTRKDGMQEHEAFILLTPKNGKNINVTGWSAGETETMALVGAVEALRASMKGNDYPEMPLFLHYDREQYSVYRLCEELSIGNRDQALLRMNGSIMCYQAV